MQRLSRKTTIALIALFIFSLLMTVFSYTDSSKDYFSFWSLFELYLIMGIPLILIFGMVASYLADAWKLRKRWRILLYALVASFVMVPYGAFIFGGAGPMLSTIGILTAVLFFVIEWLFQTYIYRAAL